MADYPELAGQVAIVTGAAAPASIGGAIAMALAEQSVRVVVADIDGAGAERLSQQIVESGSEASAHTVDVTSGDEVRGLVESTLDHYGRIDILVNNAGGFQVIETVEETPEERWRAMMALNLDSVFLCSQAVCPPMKRQGRGRIVNVSSITGRTSPPSVPAYYSAAKAAVLALTRSLARELASAGITVNAIAPGATRTERFLRLRGADAEKRFRRSIPLGRLGEPEECAAAVLFLVSGAAAYVTGATLDVNGGAAML